MPQLDFDNIDFEKIPQLVDFEEINFEGTRPISLPEPPPKESFISRIKEYQPKFFDFKAKFPQIKPEDASIIKEMVKDSLFGELPAGLGYLQKPLEEAVDYWGKYTMTAEEETAMARKHPNLMAARYAAASVLLPGVSQYFASTIDREEFAKKSIEEQRLEILGVTAGYAVFGAAFRWGTQGLVRLGIAYPWLSKPIMTALKGATWFRRMTNRERGLVTQTIGDMKSAGLKDAQILKNLRNRDSSEYKSYFAEAVKKRGLALKEAGRVSEPAEPIITPIRPESVVTRPKPTTELAKKFEVAMKAERKPPTITVLKQREIEIEKGQIDFEKVEALPEPLGGKVAAKFKYWWDMGAGKEPIAMYQISIIKGGLTDVTTKTLKEKGYDIPKTPTFEEWSKKPIEKPKIVPIIKEKIEVKPEPIRPKGKLVILKDKKKLLADIDKAIEEAPLLERTEIQPEKITFDIDGGAHIWNQKAVLQEFRKRIAKTAEGRPVKVTLPGYPKLPRPTGKKPAISEEEELRIYEERQAAEKGWKEEQEEEDTIDLFSGIPFLKVDPLILKPLRDIYIKHIGDPIWNFLSETLPVEAGKRSKFVDAINKGLIWDYRKDPKYVDLRDDTYMKIQQYREKAKEISQSMAKFSRAEQIRIAQIIKGGVTAAPKRYESAFDAIKRFQELEKDLQELGILGLDNRFRQLTRKEIADKFKEIKDYDIQIEKLRKRLQPIEKIGKVARRISEDVSEEIVSTSETEGLYEVDETKWTKLNEDRIREALMSRGFAEGETTQMINRVKESVTPLEGKKGPLKEIKTKVEKVVIKTVLQEIIKTRTYHPAMMARARGSLIKDINKLANKRSEILERIRLHYKMSGKLYLRRAYEKIEGEKTFLKHLLDTLKIRRTRLKKGYDIRRKDLDIYYREKVLGEIKKAPYLVYKGLSEESHDVELMRMFVKISKNKDWAISPEEWTSIQAVKSRHYLIPKYENFKPLPVTEKLGSLSGALVDPYIWDDLNEAVRLRNELIKAWDSVLSLWKVGKAVYNPATQCRNILSNSILADFADLPQHRIDIYARTARDFYTKSGYWKEAKENTPLLGTEWAATEAMEFLKATSELKEGSWLTASAKLVAKYLDKPGKMYQFWEQFFKLAVYTNERENGATIKAAYKKAEKFIFNYQKIPSAIRWAKRWWSPFITFSYKAIPRFTETAVRQPWKIVKYGLLMAAAEEITRRMLGESKEQIDREKKVLPDYMRKTVLPGQLSHLRVPYKDEYGRSKYLDLSFILPWGDIAEQWGQSYFVGRPFLPNHPVYVFVGEVAFDEIFFTGQDLTDKELDEGLPYWKKIGTELWRQAMPSLAGSYGYNKLMAAYHGERDWALRERSFTEAIFDVFFGLKIRSIDYNESHARRIGQLKSKINLAKQRFRKDYWKIIVNPTPDVEYDAKRQEKLWIQLGKDIDKIMEKIIKIEK